MLECGGIAVDAGASPNFVWKHARDRTPAASIAVVDCDKINTLCAVELQCNIWVGLAALRVADCADPIIYAHTVGALHRNATAPGSDVELRRDDGKRAQSGFGYGWSRRSGHMSNVGKKPCARRQAAD